MLSSFRCRTPALSLAISHSFKMQLAMIIIILSLSKREDTAIERSTSELRVRGSTRREEHVTIRNLHRMPTSKKTKLCKFYLNSFSFYDDATTF